MRSEHHWEGLIPQPDKYFGFVYLIECQIDGSKYIGKKQYWMAKPKAKGCKSRVGDKSSDRWKDSCWKESNWKSYTGSSKAFNEHIKKIGKENFRFTILGQYAARGDLVYAEARQQMVRDVMKDDKYFNGQVSSVKFKPPCKECEELC